MHPARATPGGCGDLEALRSARWSAGGSSAGPRTPAGWPRRLVCPLVRGLLIIVFLRGSPDHVSSFRAGPRGSVSGRLLHDHQQEGADQHDRGLPLRFGRRRWLLGHPVPPRSSAFLTVGLPARRLDPDGVSTFRTLKTRPAWAPSIARGRWCSPRPTTIDGLRLAHLNAVSLHRATASITARLCLTSHQRGFKRFARPVFPSPVTGGWIASPSAFPRASHPAITRSARRGGDGSSSTDPKSALRHQTNRQPRGFT